MPSRTKAGDSWAPQGEQLEVIPCGPILQDENSGTIERRGWALPREEIKHDIFLILEVKETFLTTHAQKGSLKVKKGGAATT